MQPDPHKRLPHDPPGFYFDQPEPDPRDYALGDGTNSYLKAFLAWAARRREARNWHRSRSADAGRSR